MAAARVMWPQRALDSMAAELLERGRRTQDELERVRLIPRYLSGELGFGVKDPEAGQGAEDPIEPSGHVDGGHEGGGH